MNFTKKTALFAFVCVASTGIAYGAASSPDSEITQRSIDELIKKASTAKTEALKKVKEYSTIKGMDAPFVEAAEEGINRSFRIFLKEALAAQDDEFSDDDINKAVDQRYYFNRAKSLKNKLEENINLWLIHLETFKSQILNTPYDFGKAMGDHYKKFPEDPSPAVVYWVDYFDQA